MITAFPLVSIPVAKFFKPKSKATTLLLTTKDDDIFFIVKLRENYIIPKKHRQDKLYIFRVKN